MEEKRAVLAHYLQIQQKLVQGRRVKKSVRSELPVAANLDTSEPPIKSDRSWLIIPKIKEKWWGLASIPNRTIRELHRCWPLRTRTPKSSSCEEERIPEFVIVADRRDISSMNVEVRSLPCLQEWIPEVL
ncbi:Hypothetical predicted protein [Olea europaea subsp. europaea]|uniref:Uncharacterized protein n=1 Tax=Olea europaea subsp. europaea TaxID=158383 RepID=A0A8S0QBN7_OLEEU|nr:Hypothetical predicted protein [Olea europaea subsp. europaea]